VRLRLLVLALGTFAMGVDTFVIAPILDPMARGLDVTRTTVGWLITAFALTYAVGGPLLAAAVGHRPPRLLLLGGLAVFAAGNALNAMAQNYPWALAGRSLAGAGAALYTANALATARTMTPEERRGRATATVVGGLTSAIVLGLPAGAWLGARVGWRSTLWLIVVLAAVAAAGVATAIPTLPGLPRTSLRARLAPLADVRVLTILLATGLCLSASWTVYTSIDEVMRPATGGDADRASLVLLVFGIGAVGGNLLVGRLTDRFGPTRTITVAAPLLVVTVTLIPVLPLTLGSALALALCWGTLHWMINVPQQIRVTAAAPTAAPLVLGLHQSTIYLGISAGGAAGAVGDSIGGRPGIGYAALCVGMAALTVLALTLRLRRPRRTRNSRTDSDLVGVQ
jgi:MFS transporter, DHA1 family, inner membrane transport protein